MTSKTRFVLYLIIIHVAIIAALVVFRDELGWWFFLAEAGVIISFVVGLRFVDQSMKPLEFIQAFSDVIHTGEFNARYRSTGQKDMDKLVEIYNTMLGRLQQERLALGEQRGFLERFLQVTPVGVVILNFEQQIHLLNPSAEKYLNLSLVNAKEKWLNQISEPLSVHLNGLALWESDLWNGSAGQRLRCHHGEFNDRGFLRSYYIIEDVTQELQQSERDAYEKLIRMVSHEVNNTVAATNSLLQSCQHYAGDLKEEDQQDFTGAIDVLITRNRHLNEFTHRLAGIARIPEPDKQFIKLHDLVEPIVTIFRPACVERNIQLNIDIDAQLPAVSLDQSLLEQVLINVVKNALEAVSDGGKVTILTERELHQITLSIKDNGCGLDKEVQEHLFQPFYTSKPSGQGLGLTLTKDILNLHEFGYRLETNGDETCFDIDIPAKFLSKG